jgi:hypothetical protein
MLLQPCGDRFGFATVEQINGTVAFEITEECSIPLASA